MYETAKQKDIAIIVRVVLKKEVDTQQKLAELKSLAEADDAQVVDQIVQNVKSFDKKFLMGAGKVQQIKQLANSLNANLVVFDNGLTGGQINELEVATGCKVIDRTMLILDIFARRALSTEGKLQVELAQLKYSLPRLNAISGSSGRYGSGGIGMRGPGETKIELDKRIVENKIFQKETELKKLKAERDLRRQKRKNSNIPIVAIVGYTNSGKSTLLNTITKANVLAKDMLFATLDTTTRSLWLAPNKQIMLVDTVGFVSNLPHELVEAFSSTLEETTTADLLLNVVDLSNPSFEVQEKVVTDVLASLGIKDTPIITVFNKIDQVQNINMDHTKVYISAKNNIGIDALKTKICQILFPDAKPNV